MTIFDITDYGAAGDGETFDTEAIQKAIDACEKAGGGTVLVPAPGRFRTGQIFLASRVNLHVEPGATLLSTDDADDFSGGEHFAALIEAYDAEDVSITGTGTIDGNCPGYMDTSNRYHWKGIKRRPHLIRLERCTRVTMRDVRILNAANWAVHPVGCEDVLIHGIRIDNDLRAPNTDGIDPDHCRNVRIADCDIKSADDCIVIKTRAEFPDYGPSENITVTGCTMVSTSSGVKLGTESIDDYRNIVFDGCTVTGTNRALSIQLRDKGNVENVIFSNMIVETRHFSPGWWGRAEPIYVTAIPRAEGHELGHVRHVRFANCLCRSENGAFIAGSEGRPVEDVVLDNVRLEIVKRSKWPGGMHDRRPCTSSRTDFGIAPEKDAGLVEHPTAGVYVEHARNVTLRDTHVVWGEEPQAYWRHALEAHAVEDLKLENFEGTGARPDVEARLID